MKITNHDLHVMLTEMRGDIKAVLKEQSGQAEWQEAHDKKDTERFTRLHERIDGMNKYAASIATVAVAVGLAFGLGWEWLKSKVVG